VSVIVPWLRQYGVPDALAVRRSRNVSMVTGLSGVVFSLLIAAEASSVAGRTIGHAGRVNVVVRHEFLARKSIGGRLITHGGDFIRRAQLRRRIRMAGQAGLHAG